MTTNRKERLDQSNNSKRRKSNRKLHIFVRQQNFWSILIGKGQMLSVNRLRNINLATSVWLSSRLAIECGSCQAATMCSTWTVLTTGFLMKRERAQLTEQESNLTKPYIEKSLKMTNLLKKQTCLNLSIF